MTRWSRSAGLLAAAVLLSSSACSSGSSGPSWVDQARVGPVDPLEVLDGDDGALATTVGCEPLGVDQPAETPYSPGPAGGGSADRGTGNDPYTATGARQIPGPTMSRMAPPAAPVSVVVARPADPDEHVAARQADAVDTGPVPPPRYTPGRGSPAFAGSTDETTTDAREPDGGPSDGAGSSDAEVAPCVPVLGP